MSTNADAEGVKVVDNTAAERYEIWSGGRLAGFSNYRNRPGRLVFVHTETEPGFEGQGMASRLVRGALDDVRRRQLGVMPLCPFVASFIRDHPDYQDLVVSGEPPG